MVTGIDVSGNNGDVNWRAVAHAGYDFAIIKATEGDWHDPTATRGRIAAIRRAGLIPGAYVYLRPRHGRNGAQEVDIFWRLARALTLYDPDHQRVKDVRPVLDVEESALTDAETVRYVNRAIDRIVHLTRGRHPIIYAGSYWREHLGSKVQDADRCKLWYPEYGVKAPRLIPAPWRRPAIWQHSERGRVPGVPGSCDLNRYLGRDLAQFRRELCI